MDSASTSAFFTKPGSSLALVFASLITYGIITLQFIVAMVESYILVAAAFIFLGFGGSRWSSPYVERYISLAISIGVKIMLLYLLISTGMTLSATWLNQAENTPNSIAPATDAFSIMGASLIFAALCWHTPKLVASVLGGTPSLHGSDVLSPIATVVAGGAFVASGVGAAYRGAMTAASAVGLSAGTAASAHREGLSGVPVQSSDSTPSPASPPPPRLPVPSSAPQAARVQVPPPSRSGNGSQVAKNDDSEVKST